MSVDAFDDPGLDQGPVRGRPGQQADLVQGGQARRVRGAKGEIKIGPESIKLTQAGAPPSQAPCTYAVDTTDTRAVGWEAGKFAVGIKTAAGCAWETKKSHNWITVDPARGAGPGTVGVSFPANPTREPRPATLVVVRRDHPAQPAVCQQDAETQPSTPALLDTASRSAVPDACSAPISTDGMPHNPKPPTAIVEPDAMSATAFTAVETTLSMQ